MAFSLGSCVGLSLFDRDAGVGALLHAQLPLSSSAPERARTRPAMFVDSGVVYVLDELFARGASRRRLVACIAGAADSRRADDVFQIGRRNHTVVRRILWKNDILIAAEDVGGSMPRTLVLEMASGRTSLRIGGHERELHRPAHLARGADHDL